MGNFAANEPALGQYPDDHRPTADIEEPGPPRVAVVDVRVNERAKSYRRYFQVHTCYVVAYTQALRDIAVRSAVSDEGVGSADLL